MARLLHATSAPHRRGTHRAIEPEPCQPRTDHPPTISPLPCPCPSSPPSACLHRSLGSARAAWLRRREARARRGDSPATSCRFGYERGHPRGAHRKRPLPPPRTTHHGRPPHLRLLPLAAYTWRPRPLVNLQLLAAAGRHAIGRPALHGLRTPLPASHTGSGSMDQPPNGFAAGGFFTHIDGQNRSPPSVIVIGGGISGIAAARALSNASFKVTLLESRDRLGGRVHTDYSFGCPIDMGASWLHGVCNENSLAPLIRMLGLRLYRTSGDNSVLYDHDLESYALFDKHGQQVPQEIVSKVGETFEKILKETVKVRDEHANDMPLIQAMAIVLDRNPHMKLEGLEYEVLQWCICRLEAWFATDMDNISLKNWDQEHVLTGGHGLMVNGYDPVIKALAQGLDIHLNHRVTKIIQRYNKVIVCVEDGASFVADAAIITVPLGVLKANIIKFEPELPREKLSAIADLGVGIENKIALKFNTVFWPNVEVLGRIAPTSNACGYFLNLHKATGNPVLVCMVAGRFAYEIEKLSDEESVNFVMSQLRKMLPQATEPVQYLVSRWGSDPNSLGSYSCDLVGKPADLYERFCAPVGNLFFAGEAACIDHSGSVHGAYSSGIAAAEDCRRRLSTQLGISDLFQVGKIIVRKEMTEVMVPFQISRL